MIGTTTQFGRTIGHRLAAGTAVLVLVAALTIGASATSLARGAEQLTFTTASQASHALYVAIRDKDQAAITAILGAPKKTICAEDSQQDIKERKQFVEKYKQMRRLVREPNGTIVLYIGAENWPFPFPLVSKNGIWRFDTTAGLHEILYRRIGENEMLTIQDCRQLVRKSGPKQASEWTLPMQMNGYNFRSLNGGSHVAMTTGAKAVGVCVAYPITYRSTGVMTFVVTQTGAVYAKDLGRNSANTAKSMSEFRPNSSWKEEK